MWESSTQRSSEAPDSACGNSITSSRSGLYVVARLADVGLVGERGTGVPNATISEVSVELDVSLTLALEFSRWAPAQRPDLSEVASVLQGVHLILTLKLNRRAPGAQHASAASAAVRSSCCSASGIAGYPGFLTACLLHLSPFDHASALGSCSSQVLLVTYTPPAAFSPNSQLGCKLSGKQGHWKGCL